MLLLLAFDNISNSMITEDLQEFYNLSPKGKIICIDYGLKKTGLACCDADRIMSLPLCTITARNVDDCLDQIKKTINKKQIGSIVLGLPLYLDGSSSKQTDITRRFAVLINNITKLPVLLQDERLTTKGAESYLKYFKFNRKEREKISDMTSASLMLDIVLKRIESTWPRHSRY
jgi:putative Holliday junction resolvase